MHLPPIRPLPRDEHLPVSLNQELLLRFIEQVAGFDDPSYNHFKVMELTGPLDVAALERTFREIVRRNEVFRTTFHAVDGRTVQTVAESARFRLGVFDLQHLPAAEREARARALVVEDVKRVFDLSRDLMMRANLFRLEQERHMLALTVHHLAADGWGMRLLTEEFTLLYRAFSRGQPSPLEDPPVQYADFAQWQRRWVEAADTAQLLSYYRRRLGGYRPLRLAADRPRPSALSLEGAHQRIALGASLIESLKKFSRREGATLHMTLLAAFKALLHRRSGQTDVSVLTTAAARTRVEIERSIGYFLNYLILRTDLSGDPSFRELLSRVRETAVEAFDQQEVPFALVMRELQLDWPPVLFSFQPPMRRNPTSAPQAAADSSNSPRLNLTFLELSATKTTTKGRSRRELSLYLYDVVDEIKGTVEYSTDLFDGSTIAEMINEYRALLQGIVLEPEAPLSALF